MTLADWIQQQPSNGHGARSFLQRKTELAYTTILRAAQGRPMQRATAQKISEATGGAVSVEQLLIGNLAPAFPAETADAADGAPKSPEAA